MFLICLDVLLLCVAVLGIAPVTSSEAEPPNIYEPPEVIVKAAEGQTIVLRCRVFGVPKPIVTWREGNPPREVSGIRYRILEDGDLEIMNVMQTDEGDYQCFAVNAFGEDEASGRLIVRRATMITVRPRSRVVNASTNVKFTCAATTDPKEVHQLTIEWRRNGQPIDYEEEEGRFTKDIQNNSLMITDVEISDSADYTCYASNDLDSDETTATLTVREPLTDQ